eukprot:scaffold77_cov116-Isochrysis_galbana.AAC.9
MHADCLLLSLLLLTRSAFAHPLLIVCASVFVGAPCPLVLHKRYDPPMPRQPPCNVPCVAGLSDDRARPLVCASAQGNSLD